MSLRTLENAIVAELRQVTGNRKLRPKDIQEWSTTPVESQGKEKAVKLPKLGVYVSYLEPK